MGKGIVKLGEGKWAVKDGNLLAAKETNGRFKNTEFTVSRGTRASYVGRDGLIKESNLQDVNLVNNGDFSELSSELVTSWTNKDFTSFSSSGSNITQMVSSANGNNCYSATTITSGKTYKLEFTCSQNILAQIRLSNNTNLTSAQTALSNPTLGLNTVYFTASSNYNYIGFYAASTFTDTQISSFTLKQVDPNDYWTVTDSDANNYVEFTEGFARLKFLNTSPITTLSSTLTLEPNKTYKLIVDVHDVTSGSIKIDAAGISELFNAEGVTTRYIKPTGNTTLSFYRATSNVDVTLASVSAQEVKTDTPRIDFTDNTDGHLLLEPQSTNLLTYSEDFTTWTIQSGTTVTSDTTESLSPSGEYNSSKIVGNGTSGILKASVSSAGGSNTKSIYIKGTQNGQVVYLKDPNQTVNNKALTLTTEWVRYSLTETQTSDYGIWISNIPTEGIYMWGGQVEALSYPTSYIPTNGSTVTRDAETCTGAGSSADFNSEEGVLYAEFRTLSQLGTFRQINLYQDISNRIYISKRAENDNLEFRMDNPSGNLSFSFPTNTTNDFVKVAFRYGTNNFAVFIDGINKNVNSTGTTFTANTLDKLDLTSAISQDFYGEVKALKVYKEALSDTDLQNLTS